MFNYYKICEEMLSFLPERTRDIVSRRFGIFSDKKETLEAIGKDHKITRERVRQIERDGIRSLKENRKKYNEVFSFLKDKINELGGVVREDRLLEELSKDSNQENYIIFLLSIDKEIEKSPESKNSHSVWFTEKRKYEKAEEIIKEVCEVFKKENKLFSIKELKEKIKQEVGEDELLHIIEISKKLGKNKEQKFGLSKWPDVNPKGIRDKVYITLKEAKKPLHFREIALSLGKNTNPQTTHNELIKDPSFVLVGRGVYALAEWGYVPGEVKEVITTILKKEGALHKDDIIIHVSKQRIVKKNTIIQNLSNKKYFIRTPDGKYTTA
jgi:hypothetical protein